MMPTRQLLSFANNRVPVEFLNQKFNSLNNRLNPIKNLETQAVLVCDDDLKVHLSDVEFAFEVELTDSGLAKPTRLANRSVP